MTTIDPATRNAVLTAFAKHHVAPDLRAGLAALMGGESGFRPRTEDSYAHTSAARLRSIFKTRLENLTDAYIDSIKGNDEAFFELVYGKNRQLGNSDDGDGFKFRGRGLIQLTGRANYQRYGQMVGVDLVAAPDRENELEVAIETAVVYMLDRYKGTGWDWDAMKAAVGNSFGNVDATKNALFAQYLKSGEWNAAPAAADPAPEPKPAPPVESVAGGAGDAGATPAPGSGPPATTGPLVKMEPVEALRGIQRLMQAAGFYVDAEGKPRKIDGDFRGASITGLDLLVKAAGQPGVIGQKGT